ncbi:MAG: deoxynucleoside kinase [Myxococcales bacterium]
MSKRFIALAGNIGAGKTELCQFLCRRYGLAPFYEPNEQNPYLADFYRDMKAYAFKSQIYFLTHKFRLHRQLEEAAGAAVQDRTIYEDAEIFAQNLHRQRLIDERDWQTYSELYRVVGQTLRPPDLMIYLRAPVRTLRQRIRRRARSFEQGVSAAYLRRLNRLYEDWMERYRLSPLVVLESDRLDYLTDLVDRVEVLGQVERYL